MLKKISRLTFALSAVLFVASAFYVPAQEPPVDVITSGLTTTPTAPLAIDATNKQYFYYGDATVALVGVSGEYLPHIKQGPNEATRYCTYGTATDTHDTYIKCVNELRSRGLNRIRMWLAINHSPGITEHYTAANPNPTPYPSEHPFPYDPQTRKWNLNVNQWDGTWLARVKDVIRFCQGKGVIVEVTLFDAFAGESSPAGNTGPWFSANNTPGVGFTQRKYFNSFETNTGDIAGSPNAAAREVQYRFVDKIVAELNQFNNIYWEIANEPDLNGEAVGAPLYNWHNAIAERIWQAEETITKQLGKNRHHPIAANYASRAAINNAGLTTSRINIVNGHYARVIGGAGSLPAADRFGAIPINYTFNLGSTGAVNKLFGFNEGRITAAAGHANNPATATTARAEAWEFMLGAGGLYDHLSYDWFVNNESTKARQQLGVLNNFLAGLNLRMMTRQTLTAPPFWVVSGLPTYGTSTTYTVNGVNDTSNTYWSAMQWARNQYVLYIHHSTIAQPGAAKYSPHSFSPGIYSHNLTIRPGNLSGCYRAEWIKPETGARLGAADNFWWNDNDPPHNVPPQTYEYDIALRVKRTAASMPCPTN